METKRYVGEARRPGGMSVMCVVIVFVIDATGSMARYIDGAVRAVTGFIDILVEGSLQPSLGLVIFRDELIEEPTLCYDVGTAPEEIKRILRSTEATGGGDEPESSLPAIMKALDLPGFASDARKVLIHVTDAGCHDPENGLGSDEVLARLKKEKVLFHACCPDTPPYTTFVNATGGTLFPIRTDLQADTFAGVMLSFARSTVKTLQMGDTANTQEVARKRLRETRILEP